MNHYEEVIVTSLQRQRIEAAPTLCATIRHNAQRHRRLDGQSPTDDSIIHDMCGSVA